MNSEDTELRKALGRLADQSPPPQSIHEIRSRAGLTAAPRTRSLVAAFAVPAALVIGIAGVWAITNDRGEAVATDVAATAPGVVASVPSPDEPDRTTAAPQQPVLEDPPHLLAEADGWAMTYFSDQSYPPTAAGWMPQLFRSGTELADPTIALSEYEANDPADGLSSAINPEIIEMDDRTIELLYSDTLPYGFVAGLTFDDGTLVYAEGYGLDRNEFIEVIGASVVRDGNAELPTHPQFAPVELDEPWSEPIIRREAEYVGSDGSAQVRTWSGSRSDVELHALGRALEALAVRAGTIDGNPVMVADQGDSRYFIVGGTDRFVIEIDLQLDPDAPDGTVDLFLDSMRLVDLATFEAATPADSITNQDQDAAIAEMLADIPLPDGFDASKLADSGSRYQVGAHVAGQVACAWINQWVTATESGDTARAKQASDALATSRQWAILVEMEPDGGYPDVLWGIADAIAADGTITQGQELPVKDFYQDALDCSS